MAALGLHGCLPRFFFFARSAARRCFRGGLRPGRSSELGGIEEFPLFRDLARSAAASCSRSSATTASSAAIRSACVSIRSACVSIRCACSRISASRGSPAAHRSQSRIIPETTLSHHGNTTPAAKT